MAAHAQLPHINVFNRLAFLERIIDGLPSARELSFDQLYQRWKQARFDEDMIPLGHVFVSYNGGPTIDFIPSENTRNRHQALALSLYLSSIWKNQPAVVESPHEEGGIFTATFSPDGNGGVQYITAYGTRVCFTFNTSQNSQFA